MLAVLEGNRGFSQPHDWIPYALAHGFTAVRAELLERCPDCRSQQRERVAQYVYYSSLAGLWRCAACALVYSDLRIDSELIRQHFERAYKDEAYFLAGRRPVFDQLSRLVDRLTPRGGRVLDVGGARGHLLAMIAARRPDLRLTLTDLSAEACADAQTRGLEAICGGVEAIETLDARFDTVILSDVLYYEPDVSRMWRAVGEAAAGSASILIRTPNKHRLTALAQAVRGILARPALQARVPFFNPEHLYILTPKYLRRRLGTLGCTSISLHASPPLSMAVRTLGDSWYGLARAASLLSGGRLIVTPSMLVVGRRPFPIGSGS